MRRRDLLIGAGSVAALGGGAAIAFDLVGSDDAVVEAIELETLDAPGSAAGTALVPERGRVTFVELFATWCNVCQAMMPELSAANAAVGEEIQFVSATNEPLGNTVTREDVAAWWVDHGGEWAVAVDPDLDLTRALGASGVPYAFVLDEANRIRWRHRGRTDAAEIESQIRAVTG